MLDLSKQIGKKGLEIETVLKQALHLEAITRIEEEEQTTKIAVDRRDETNNLVEEATKLVYELSVEDKQRENRQNHLGEGIKSRGWCGGVKRDRIDQNRGFINRRRFPTPGHRHRDRSFGKNEPSRTNKKQGFKCRACGQRENIPRNCRNCFLGGSSQHLKRNCPFEKKNHWEP